MPRQYQCGRCNGQCLTDGVRGPVPKYCPPCKVVLGLKVQGTAALVLNPEVTAPSPPPVATPFNSTPDRAPLPEKTWDVERALASVPERPPPGDPDDYRPGILEENLKRELEAMNSTNPMAGTLAGVALKVARAADMADPSDIKQVLTSAKELRSILDQLAKQPIGGDEDDDPDSGPFGAVRPQVVNPPAV
jgi:hypothetical protein